MIIVFGEIIADAKAIEGARAALVKMQNETRKEAGCVSYGFSIDSVCGYHIRESGCSPVQEIAYAFQIANTYIEEVLRRGPKIDDFVRGFTFNINVFGNLWEQVAKFRAARNSGQ